MRNRDDCYLGSHLGFKYLERSKEGGGEIKGGDYGREEY
jgi:hypothetical protein